MPGRGSWSACRQQGLVAYSGSKKWSWDLGCQHACIHAFSPFTVRMVSLIFETSARPPSSTPPLPRCLLQEGITVLEGLAASGLRAIRYAKEIEGVAKVRPVQQSHSGLQVFLFCGGGDGVGRRAAKVFFILALPQPPPHCRRRCPITVGGGQRPGRNGGGVHEAQH